MRVMRRWESSKEPRTAAPRAQSKSPVSAEDHRCSETAAVTLMRATSITALQWLRVSWVPNPTSPLLATSREPDTEPHTGWSPQSCTGKRARQLASFERSDPRVLVRETRVGRPGSSLLVSRTSSHVAGGNRPRSSFCSWSAARLSGSPRLSSPRATNGQSAQGLGLRAEQDSCAWDQALPRGCQHGGTGAAYWRAGRRLVRVTVAARRRRPDARLLAGRAWRSSWRGG